MTIETLIWTVCCSLCLILITILGWGATHFIQKLDEVITKFEKYYEAMHKEDTLLWRQVGLMDKRIVVLETVCDLRKKDCGHLGGKEE